MRHVPYRNIFGASIYSEMRKRPDLATNFSLLGKFQVDPTPSNWNVLEHVLRYLQGLAHKGILISYSEKE